jgi:hypothetical protein
MYLIGAFGSVDSINLGVRLLPIVVNAGRPAPCSSSRGVYPNDSRTLDASLIVYKCFFGPYARTSEREVDIHDPAAQCYKLR